MVIFPRKNFREYFIINGSSGYTAEVNVLDEWETMILWRISNTLMSLLVMCQKKKNVFLILDNPASPLTVPDTDFCKDKNVVLSLPPHPLHTLQPLDRVIFVPFKSSRISAQEVRRECVSTQTRRWPSTTCLAFWRNPCPKLWLHRMALKPSVQ